MEPGQETVAPAEGTEGSAPVVGDQAASVGDGQAKPADAASTSEDNKFEHKKCFVGGLNHTTDEAGMKAYFSKFGPVVDQVVMRDSLTKQSRGFGFVTFGSNEAYEVCMAGGPHMIDGHKVEPKAAIKRQDSHSQKIPKRLFAGGLPQGITEEDFRAYFVQFGEVDTVEIMYDRETKRMRGFGFVTFTSDEAAAKCIQKGNHEIQGKFVELKGAETREQRVSGLQRGGYGGGYGRGGYGAPPAGPYGGGPRGGYGRGPPMRGGPPSLTGHRQGPASDHGYGSYGAHQGGYNGAQGGYPSQQGYGQHGYAGNQGASAPYHRNDRPPSLAGARPLGGGARGYDDQRASHGGAYGGADQGAHAPAPQSGHDQYGGYGGYGGYGQQGQPHAAAGGAAYGGYEQGKPDMRGAYEGYGGQAQADPASYGQHSQYQQGYDQQQGQPQGHYGSRGAPAEASTRAPARLTPQRGNYAPY